MPPGAEGAERSTVPARTVLLLGLLATFGPISLDLYLPALPALAGDLGASASSAQLTITTCLLGLALGQLVAGPLSDRFGRRTPLLAGLVVYLLATLACTVAPTVEVLLGLRLLQGLAGAAGLVISRAMARDLFSGRALLVVFSRLTLVSGLAPVVAPVLGGQLARVTSWRGIFVVLAAFGVVLLVAGLLLPESLPPERRTTGGLPASLRGFAALLRDRRYVGVVTTFSFSSASMFAYIAGATFVLQQIYGLSAVGFSLVFGANSVGIVVVSQAAGRLARRGGSPLGTLATGVAGNVLGAVALLLTVLLDLGVVALVVSLFVMVASLGAVFPSGTTLAMADHPERAGAASSLLGLGQYVGGGLVAPLVGIAGERTDVPLGVVACACSVVGALLLLLVVRPTARRAPRPAPPVVHAPPA